MMNLILTLTLAHLLADFPLQTNSIAINKSKSLQGLITHVLIHVAAMITLIGFQSRLFPLIATLGVLHFLIDFIKVRCDPQSVGMFVVDQAAHIGTILLVCLNFGPIDGVFQPVLSPYMLDFSLFVASFLAIMVLFWLWVNNLNDETIRRYSSLRWGRSSLLELEQRAGFGLICVLGIGAMFIR